MFEGIGHDGFQDSARSAQRNVIVRLLQCALTIKVSLLEDRAQFGVVHEIEPVRRRFFGGRRGVGDAGVFAGVQAGERGNRLLEDSEQSLDNLGRRRSFDGVTAAERIRNAWLNERASQWALLPPDN